MRNTIALPSKRKRSLHLKERALHVLFFSFLFVTIVYIYNESRLPVYQASTRAFFVSKTPVKSDVNPFNHYLAKMDTHLRNIQAQGQIEELYQHPRIQKILEIEKNNPARNFKIGQRNKNYSKGAMMNRFIHSLDFIHDIKTQSLVIKSTDTNPLLSTTMANLLPQLYHKNMIKNVPLNKVTSMNFENMQKNIKSEGTPLSLFENERITLQEQPLETIFQYAPQKYYNLAYALIAGMLMGWIVFELSRYLKIKIKSESDIEQHLNLPVLGVIPKGSK